MKTSADKEVQFYTRAAPSWKTVVHCSSPYIMAEMLYICSPCQHPRAEGGISACVCVENTERDGREGEEREQKKREGERKKRRREGKCHDPKTTEFRHYLT